MTSSKWLCMYAIPLQTVLYFKKEVCMGETQLKRAPTYRLLPHSHFTRYQE